MMNHNSHEQPQPGMNHGQHRMNHADTTGTMDHQNHNMMNHNSHQMNHGSPPNLASTNPDHSMMMADDDRNNSGADVTDKMSHDMHSMSNDRPMLFRNENRFEIGRLVVTRKAPVLVIIDIFSEGSISSSKVLFIH